MSNAIIRQQGAGSVVTDNLWEFRLGVPAFVLGGLAGVLSTVVVGRLARRAPRRKPPTPRGWPVNFAHRGGAKVVPEDTVEGFREAERLAGQVVLELDVHTSADGVVVVTHDPTVERTTDGEGPVAEKTFAEIQRLDAGYRFTTDGGRTFPCRGRGVQIPALEEVYRTFPDRPVNIEIKGERSGIEEAIARVIEAAGGQHRTLVVTDGIGTIRRFRKASGGTVATAASTGEFLVFWVVTLLRLGDLYDPPFQALQPPETYKGLRVVTPRLVREAHRRGLRVDVWTVDDEPSMRRLLGYGVDGIMTDRPDVLAGVLEIAAPQAAYA